MNQKEKNRWSLAMIAHLASALVLVAILVEAGWKSPLIIKVLAGIGFVALNLPLMNYLKLGLFTYSITKAEEHAHRNHLFLECPNCQKRVDHDRYW